MKHVAEELIRVARLLLSVKAAEIEGEPKRKALRIINKLIDPLTKGLHKDTGWRPVNDIWTLFNNMGLDWRITKSEYEHENGVPVRKVWTFEIEYENDRGKPTTLYGRVVGSGAGRVSDPLESYDVTAYVS